MTAPTTAQHAHTQATRYLVNARFDQAALFFSDDSFIQFEHTSRDNRWAKASAPATMAEDLCVAMRQFRLNAKHLQLYFEDGSDVEFGAKKEDEPPS